jgi:1-aminocyclopropane-1-carboxylate deaminase
MPINLKKAVIEQLQDPLFAEKELQIYILRLDTIHLFIKGNKWYKLKYNLEEFKNSGSEFLVTFGGAYSNHIVATASAGKELGIKTIGIIRGEELDKNSNDYLKFASSCGMQLIFISRENYRRIREDHSLVETIIPNRKARLCVLPEGGSNALAIKGSEEIIRDIPIDFDVISVACGTGSTITGIVNGLKNHQRAVGISVLSGADFLDEKLKAGNSSGTNSRIIHDYHFGGYGYSSKELDQFCKAFSTEKKIPIEPIYTGKLFFGLYDLIRKDFFNSGEKIVAVHSGGIHSFP